MTARRILAVMVLALLTALLGCAPAPTSDDIQRQQQEGLLMEGTKAIGMPAITHFQERRLLKMVLELRDQSDLSTWTYLWSDVQGRLVFLCHSVGYGIPYATQFTNPQKVGDLGNARYLALPQADPNGLFSPASADGTWIMCKDPGGTAEVKPLLVEPRAVVSPFELPPLGALTAPAPQPLPAGSAPKK